MTGTSVVRALKVLSAVNVATQVLPADIDGGGLSSNAKRIVGATVGACVVLGVMVALILWILRSG